MHDKTETQNLDTNPLKALSAAEFAALGAESVVYLRTMTGGEFNRLFPQGHAEPDDATVHMLISADGTPVLASDNTAALEEWLETRPVGLVTLH